MQRSKLRTDGVKAISVLNHFENGAGISIAADWLASPLQTLLETDVPYHKDDTLYELRICMPASCEQAGMASLIIQSDAFRTAQLHVAL
jgi:hypothetical protein